MRSVTEGKKSFIRFSGAQKQMLIHRYRKAKIDCLSLFMCPLVAQLKIGFFSSFSAAAVYGTNETNKAGLKQSIIFRCLCVNHTEKNMSEQ